MASGRSDSSSSKRTDALQPTSGLPKSLRTQAVLIFMPNLLYSDFLCHHRAFVDAPLGAGKTQKKLNKTVLQFCSYSPDYFADLAPNSCNSQADRH